MLNKQLIEWDDHKVSVLKKLWKSGDSAGVIAEKLGCERGRLAVIGKAKRLKLGPHPSAVARKRKPANPKIVIAQVVERAPSIDGPPLPSDLRFIKNKAAWEALPGSKPIPLLELTAHTCRWSVGPDEHPRLFCGLATVKNRPWCETHDHLSQPKF